MVSTGMLIFSALVGINTDEIAKSSANSIQLHSHKICLGKWSEHPTIRACPLAPQVPAWEVRKKGALCVATCQSLCVRRAPMVINGINLLESSPSTLPPFTLIPIYTSFLSSCSLTCDGWWGREGLLHATYRWSHTLPCLHPRQMKPLLQDQRSPGSVGELFNKTFNN